MSESTPEQKASAYRDFLCKLSDAIDEVRVVGVPSEESGDFWTLTADLEAAALHFDEHVQRDRERSEAREREMERELENLTRGIGR